jgi:prolyl oligopeptidase
MTGDNDDSVVPMHSCKFAAALQYAQTGSAPILLRIYANAGHQPDRQPLNLVIEQAADKWAFALSDNSFSTRHRTKQFSILV